MRKIRVTDSSGNHIGNFPSLTKAAESVGMTKAALHYRIMMGLATMGKIFTYMDKEPPQKKEKAPEKKKNDAKANRKVLKEELESINEQNVLEIESTARKIGLSVNRIPFELKWNVLSITPCVYRESTPEKPRPMVGSAACVTCHYFKGRSKKNRYVLCSFKLIN